MGSAKGGQQRCLNTELKEELELMRRRWVGSVGRGMPGGQTGPAEGRGRGRSSEWVGGSKDGAGCVRSGVTDQALKLEGARVPGGLAGPASWGPAPPAPAQETFSSSCSL